MPESFQGLSRTLTSDPMLPMAFCKCIFWDMMWGGRQLSHMYDVFKSKHRARIQHSANLQTGCVVSSGGSPAIFSLLPHTLPPPSTCLASCPPLAHFSSVSHTAGIQRLKHFSSVKETAPSSLTPPLVDKTQAQPALESA